MIKYLVLLAASIALIGCEETYIGVVETSTCGGGEYSECRVILENGKRVTVYDICIKGDQICYRSSHGNGICIEDYK